MATFTNAQYCRLRWELVFQKMTYEIGIKSSEITDNPRSGLNDSLKVQLEKAPVDCLRPLSNTNFCGYSVLRPVVLI